MDFSFGFGLGNSAYLLSGYNPLINYNWSTTTTSGLRYLKDVGSTPKYDASMYFGRGAYLNGVDQSITIPINATIQTALKRVNGVVTINETSQTLTNYVISGLGVHKDYYLFTRLLTTSEKDSYINTPEEFYAMAQADSTCVLNMPMCETDGYVRNMKTYSEGVDLITNGTFDTNFDGWGAASSAILTVVNGRCRIETPLGDSAGAITQVVSGLTIGKTYAFKYNAESPSLGLGGVAVKVSSGGGNWDLYNGQYIEQKTPSDTIVTFVATTTSITIYLYSTGLGDAGQYAYYDNVSIKEVTGIYPISNYTSSVRNNAKNLQYGLQTCKFVRDGLGVIQTASDYLECDGVGYGDTGWMPSVGKDWSIELICQSKGVIDFGVQSTGWLIVSQSQGKKYFIYLKNSIINTVNSYLYGSSVCLSLVYTEKLKTLTLYENSIYVNSVTMDTSIYPLTVNFLLGKRNGGGQLSEGILRLFKVHNKALTQEEITANYNDYVSKGLLA